MVDNDSWLISWLMLDDRWTSPAARRYTNSAVSSWGYSPWILGSGWDNPPRFPMELLHVFHQPRQHLTQWKPWFVIGFMLTHLMCSSNDKRSGSHDVTRQWVSCLTDHHRPLWTPKPHFGGTPAATEHPMVMVMIMGSQVKTVKKDSKEKKKHKKENRCCASILEVSLEGFTTSDWRLTHSGRDHSSTMHQLQFWTHLAPFWECWGFHKFIQ